jgi:phage terminase large subunit-like protein
MPGGWQSVAKPFTIGHFEKWAKTLILDSGELWKPEPFQLNFIEDVFSGAAENWLITPESNGKTTLLAGFGLYGLEFAEDAMIPIAASTRDQAKILYRQAKGFVRRGGLDKRGKTWFEAYDGWRRIDLRGHNERNKRGTTLGSIEVHAADAAGADGVIPYPYAFLDELHRHKTLELYETWLGKRNKRGHQTVIISTAGAPGSDFEDARERIRSKAKVTKRGRAFIRAEAPGLVFHEHAVPEGADTNDLELVAEANPFSGVTIETLKAKKASLTMSEAHWRRFTCNIASQLEAELFISQSDWNKCLDAHEIEEGAHVCIGADGSRTWDTTVVAWATALADHIDVDCRVFSVRPEAAHHILHEGGKVDFGDVEAFLVDLFDKFHPLATAYDPRYLERSMEIVDVRLPSNAVIAVEPQTKHARDAYQALYTAVLEGKLRHKGDPVIAAHLANCAVDRDERTREIRRLRKIDPRKPIDAIPALALAVWRATLAQPSVYEERQIVSV